MSKKGLPDDSGNTTPFRLGIEIPQRPVLRQRSMTLPSRSSSITKIAKRSHSPVSSTRRFLNARRVTLRKILPQTVKMQKNNLSARAVPRFIPVISAKEQPAFIAPHSDLFTLPKPSAELEFVLVRTWEKLGVRHFSGQLKIIPNDDLAGWVLQVTLSARTLITHYSNAILLRQTGPTYGFASLDTNALVLSGNRCDIHIRGTLGTQTAQEPVLGMQLFHSSKRSPMSNAESRTSLESPSMILPKTLLDPITNHGKPPGTDAKCNKREKSFGPSVPRPNMNMPPEWVDTKRLSFLRPKASPMKSRGIINKHVVSPRQTEWK
eukprot:Ihof_evm5s167 gene=Ihof_evmTU5s167